MEKIAVLNKLVEIEVTNKYSLSDFYNEYKDDFLMLVPVTVSTNIIYTRMEKIKSASLIDNGSSLYLKISVHDSKYDTFIFDKGNLFIFIDSIDGIPVARFFENKTDNFYMELVNIILD